jgi:hypothetical protein
LRTGCLWTIFGPKGDEVIGGLTKIHNEKLYKFYSSPNIIRMIMSRRIRWTEHIARIGAKRSVYRILA